jgi:hypothetical protein
VVALATSMMSAGGPSSRTDICSRIEVRPTGIQLDDGALMPVRSHQVVLGIIM